MPIIDENAALRRAIEEGAKSPCSKSKRGVAIWKAGHAGDHEIVSAHNGPPPGFACDGTDACRAACGRLCLHAEMRALFHKPRDATDLLHVKVVNGVGVPSGPPSCVDCSKAILDRGISRVWLLHETGLRLYSARDFHVQSVLNNELPLIRQPMEDQA